jgi:hypothetical protein
MYRQGHPRTGTYLDVRRYPAINARTDAPHQYGARLGYVHVAGDGKIPWSAQQFRAEVQHRPFPGGPDYPASPVGGHSFFVGRIGVHSPGVLGDGVENQVQHFQKPPVSGLCLSPLGENAPIPRSHVPG